MKFSSEIIISDVHFPSEDKTAWNLALKFVEAVKPDTIVLLGDIIDNYTTMRHPKAPDYKFSFQEELLYAAKELARLRFTAPNTAIKYFEGNHETRPQRFIADKCPELASLDTLNIPSLLGLGPLDIEWLPTGSVYAPNGLYHHHGDWCPGADAKAKYCNLRVSSVFGHHHRFSYHFARTMDGQFHETFGNACLCDLSPEFDPHPQWHHGILYVQYYGDKFKVQPIKFEKMSNGKYGGMLIGECYCEVDICA